MAASSTSAVLSKSTGRGFSSLVILNVKSELAVSPSLSIREKLTTSV